MTIIFKVTGFHFYLQDTLFCYRSVRTPTSEEKAGQLTKDFYKQIAFDGGIDLRVDIDIIVIRLDLAVPFYKPWLPEGQRWTIKEMKPGDPDWRKENLVWNFALGYPF